jgi:hypothetical protein
LPPHHPRLLRVFAHVRRNELGLQDKRVPVICRTAGGMRIAPGGLDHRPVVAAHAAVVRGRKEHHEVAVGVQIEPVHRDFVSADDHSETVPSTAQRSGRHSSSGAQDSTTNQNLDAGRSRVKEFCSSAQLCAAAAALRGWAGVPKLNTRMLHCTGRQLTFARSLARPSHQRYKCPRHACFHRCRPSWRSCLPHLPRPSYAPSCWPCPAVTSRPTIRTRRTLPPT